MRAKPLIEVLHTNYEGATKRMWEHANAASHLLRIANQNVEEVQFPNIRGGGRKQFSASDLRDSAKNMRLALLWEWCLIVGIARFDAWLEEAVRDMHTRFPWLRGEACLKGYREATPSFSTEFFTKDQAAIGLEFSKSSKLVQHFVAWKEARNSLVHKGGRATERCAQYGRFTAGKKILLNSEDARDALACLFELADEVQRQIRRQSKSLYKHREG